LWQAWHVQVTWPLPPSSLLDWVMWQLSCMDWGTRWPVPQCGQSKLLPCRPRSRGSSHRTQLNTKWIHNFDVSQKRLGNSISFMRTLVKAFCPVMYWAHPHLRTPNPGFKPGLTHLRTPNPGFNPGLTPFYITNVGVNSGWNPGFGILRCGPCTLFYSTVL
jgi:hypothetical protein